MRALAVVLATLALAGTAVASPPKLTVSPFTSEDHTFSVTFTAPWTTAGRMRYFAVWRTLGTETGCSTVSDGPIGRLAYAGQKVKINVRGLRSMGYRFCAGPSELTVFFQVAGTGSRVAGTARTMRLVGKTRLAVA